jgi:hypothetical protein
VKATLAGLARRALLRLNAKDLLRSELPGLTGLDSALARRYLSDPD